MLTALRGMGDFFGWPGSQPAGSFPPECSWMPFSSFLAACQPPTPEQVRANDMSNLGGSVDPAIVEQLKQEWAQTDKQQCAAHPEDCAAYQFAIANPTLSAAIGTGTPAQTVRNIADLFSGNPAGGITPWIWTGLAVLGGILLFQVIKR